MKSQCEKLFIFYLLLIINLFIRLNIDEFKIINYIIIKIIVAFERLRFLELQN